MATNPIVDLNRHPVANEATAGRSVPHSEEAEQAILAAIILNNKALDRIADYLRADQFYTPLHGRLYEACLGFRQRGRSFDEITLKTLFEEDPDLSSVDGTQYIAEIASIPVATSHIEDYADTVVDLFLRRQLMELADEIVAKAQDRLGARAEDHLQAVTDDIFQLNKIGDLKKEFEPLAVIARAALDRTKEAMKRTTPLTGVTTGLADLDRQLGGLQKSDLLIVAARPGMGKSALATTVAYNAALRHLKTEGREGAPAAIFSMEMSGEQLAGRLLSSASRLNSDAIRKGDLDQRQFEALLRAYEEQQDIPLYVDDTAGMSLSALRTRAMRLQTRHNIGLLVIDYLQLMRSESKRSSENRVQEVSEITRGLKILAKELDIPVIALSQLSRQVEQRTPPIPQLSDLRESGSIEQDADVVMFIYRQAYYEEQGEPSEDDAVAHSEWREKMDSVDNVADIIVAKQRHGPTGKVRLKFDGAFTHFSDWERFRTPDDR
ncbi:MAG: replicative DNA helicase [Pseudomonadota bacterium]